MGRPTFDVLGLGVVAIDDVVYVELYPPADGKARIIERVRRPGGLAGAALAAAANLGSHVAYAGRLGSDPLSAEARRALVAAGIDVTHVVTEPQARPYASVVVVDRTARTRAVMFEKAACGGAHPDLPDASVIRRARVLLIDGYGVDGMLRAARIAREGGAAVVADIEDEDVGVVADALIRAADHVVMSMRTAQRITQAASPDEATAGLWSAHLRALVLTDGARGAWFRTGHGSPVILQPVFVVDARDTTGCGDAFHGAYAHAIAHGATVGDAVRLASAAAAALSESEGTDHLPPTHARVMRLLERGTVGPSRSPLPANPRQDPKERHT